MSEDAAELEPGVGLAEVREFLAGPTRTRDCDIPGCSEACARGSNLLFGLTADGLVFTEAQVTRRQGILLQAGATAGSIRSSAAW